MSVTLSSIHRAILILVLAAILTTILDVRPFDDVGERFIGHADAANAALVARNIAEGNGAVTDVVWLLHNGGRSGPEIRHLEAYWSIYQAYYLAVFFKLFGACLQSMLLAASLIKVAVAGLGFYWVWCFTGRELAAVTCGIVLLTIPEMVQIVNGKSDIILVFAILLVVSSLVCALDRPSVRWWACCGAATGIAIGTKPSGLLVVGLVIAGWAIAPRHRETARHIWAWALAGLTCLAPLAIHNYRAAGTLIWPDLLIMKSALTQMDSERDPGPFLWSKETREIWNETAYNPEPRALTPQRGPARIETYVTNLEGFAKRFLAGRFVPIWVLPFVFLAIVSWADWSRRQIRRPEPAPEDAPGDTFGGTRYQLFVAVTVILSAGACCVGALVHTEVRYFIFLVPPFIIVSIVEAARLSPRLLVFILVFGLALATTRYKALSARALDTRRVEAYAVIDAILPPDAVVMTQNPWEFSFHVRRPSVIVPYNPRPKVIREIAGRFRARYLVIVKKDLRHPDLRSWNKGRLPRFLKPLHQSKDVLVARFVPRGRNKAQRH